MHYSRALDALRDPDRKPMFPVGGNRLRPALAPTLRQQFRWAEQTESVTQQV